MSSNSCSSKSGHCAFCGEPGNTPSPIPIAYGAAPEEGRGTFTKLKPLRWRFLTNKAPRTKYMCSACAEKRQVPQKTEQPVSLDSSWDGSQKHSEPALRLEHLESHDAVRQQRKSQRMQSEKIEKLQERYPERRENRRSTREPLSSNGRRRGSSQTSEAQHDSARRSSVLQPFANHRKSRESIIRNRPASTVEIRTRTSVTNQRASVDTPTRPRKSSTGQSEPRGSEKGPAVEFDSRYPRNVPVAGAATQLLRHELFVAYIFCTGARFCRLETDRDAVTPNRGRKKNETEEERQRRRSASYATCWIRAERRAKSVAVHSVKEDEPVKMDPADFAVDLDYLRAYKDAR
ncbi:hypothetical protein GQ600_747 [Phytophthora cactorum]|nr:hypothetical protein GQ600_747 [Phytophthora cactorum]